MAMNLWRHSALRNEYYIAWIYFTSKNPMSHLYNAKGIFSKILKYINTFILRLISILKRVIILVAKILGQNIAFSGLVIFWVGVVDNFHEEPNS